MQTQKLHMHVIICSQFRAFTACTLPLLSKR